MGPGSTPILDVRHVYCGAPPAPDDLWRHWNLDPFLATALCLVFVAYIVGAKRASTPAWRTASFAAGWLIGGLALISPLCSLSVALFSARVGQHMLLALVSAPLVVLGRPGDAFRQLAPRASAAIAHSRLANAIGSAGGSILLFISAIWIWHAPAPYDATFHSLSAYWLMHLSVYGGALLVWNTLLDPALERAVTGLWVGAISTLQMTFLGALITLSPRALYAPHALSPLAWGMTQIGDQQLGGLIMWVPGCAIFLAITLVTLGRLMSDGSERHAAF